VLKLSGVTNSFDPRRFEGTVTFQFLAESLTPSAPATWCVAVSVVSRNGQTHLAELVPITTGTDTLPIGALQTYVVGPITMLPFDCPE
jgi:hypothetical protein